MGFILREFNDGFITIHFDGLESVEKHCDTIEGDLYEVEEIETVDFTLTIYKRVIK